MAVISGKRSKTTLTGTNANDSIYNSLDNYYVLINAGAGNDYVENFGDYSSIFGGDGNDKIENYGDVSTINAGAGNDVISLDSYSYDTRITYKSGDGNDTIYGFNDTDTLDITGTISSSVQSGNNAILKIGSNTITLLNYSLNGGVVEPSDGGENTVKGDNSIAETFTYTSGDLTIKDYDANDVVELKSSSISSYSFNGGDLILKTNKGNITLENMTNHYITVKNSAGKQSTTLYSNGMSQQTVIKNVIQELVNNAYVSDATTALDNAVKYATKFSGIQDALDSFLSDRLNAVDGDTFLKKYCGIIIDNSDTGAITGWDSGGAVAKTAESVVPENGNAKTPSGTSFTVDGLTIKFGNSLSTTNQTIVNNLYTWWIGESLDLIKESYGIGFDSGSPIYNTMNLDFENQDDGILAYVSTDYYYQDTRMWDSVKMVVNNYYYSSIDPSDKNGTATEAGASYLDRVISHELTHAVQMATFGDLPTFFTEGLAELTHGIDDFRTTTIQSLADNYSSLKNVVSSALDPNVWWFTDAPYAGGYMFWKYLAKQTADSYGTSSSNLTSKNV